MQHNILNESYITLREYKPPVIHYGFYKIDSYWYYASKKANIVFRLGYDKPEASISYPANTTIINLPPISMTESLERFASNNASYYQQFWNVPTGIIQLAKRLGPAYDDSDEIPF